MRRYLNCKIYIVDLLLYLLLVFLFLLLSQEAKSDIIEEKRVLISEDVLIPPSNRNQYYTKDTQVFDFQELHNREAIKFKVCSEAKIIALNKTTAKAKELIIPIGINQYFGDIEIKIHKCLKNLDPYVDDNNVLLTITEHRIEEDQLVLFQGWMSSQDIAVTALEHPVYEILIKECL